MPKIRIHIYCKQIIAPNFTSPQIENFCQQHDIEHIRVKTNSNGLVERAIQACEIRLKPHLFI